MSSPKVPGADPPAHPWGESGPELTLRSDVLAEDREPIVELLSRCDPGLLGTGQVEVACLPGGANNRNYTATGGDGKLAVRIANNFSERFAVDRASAIQAQRDAAAADLAPAVMAARLPEGHTVSAFLEGETLWDESIRQEDALRGVARAIRELHATPSSCREYSPFDEVRVWTEWARRDETEMPEDFEAMIEICDRIERLVGELRLPLAFCHNDTVPQNFIRAPDDTVRMVDWDFAGRGWASFEVASFIAIAQLDDRQREIFLDVYGSDATEAQRATLELLGFVGEVREVTWAQMAAPVLPGTTTPLDGWSYESYRDTYLTGARKRLAQPGFDSLFAAARSELDRPW
ncbi:MAG: phosphotransferase [Solirubrobacterales bacterium]